MKAIASEAMRRLAVFVEGYTELLFVDRLVREVAAKNRVAIHHKRILGGGRSGRTPKSLVVLTTPDLTGDETRYVLIVDCCGDRLVAQRIREEHPSLTKQGYEKIIGIRDVFPDFTKPDIPKLKRNMQHAIRTNLVPVQFILAVMEIEAWFLAEHNHFPFVHEDITAEAIRANLGFDPRHDDMTDRPQPAADMNAAYQIGGKTYLKGNAESTIDKLSYDYIYVALRERIDELGKLLRTVDEFMS